MRLMAAVMCGLLAAPAIAGAQSPDEVQISIGGFELAANGAEKPVGVWRRTGQLSVGTPTVGVFSTTRCGAFSVTRPPNSFEEGATAGWRVEVTPLKIVNHAVTFRLRWVRALDKGNGLEPVSEDVEVTLRPGESRPVDSVPVPPGTKRSNGRPCDLKEVSLRVSADFPDFDRRLIGADLWLVERLANGEERSQLQSVRGTPHRPIPFYFDSLADGARRLDFFGKLIADPQSGDIEISLETIRATGDPGQDGYHAARWFRSTVQMKPNEIVDVALTEEGDTAAPPKRVFSIRIRTKQIR